MEIVLPALKNFQIVLVVMEQLATTVIKDLPSKMDLVLVMDKKMDGHLLILQRENVLATKDME